MKHPFHIMRKRALALVAVLTVTLVTGACGVDLRSSRKMVLEVTGTEGTPVTGEYIVTVGTNTTRHPVDRTVPFSVEVEGHDMSGYVQKIGDAGTVRMRLLVNGNAVAFDWTKDRFGNLRVATP